MGDPWLWLLIVVLGVGTFVLRLSFIHFGDFLDDLPDGTEDILELIPVAVLSALVFPRLFLVDSTGIMIINNEYLLTGILSGAIAWRTGSLLITVVFGISFLWLFQNIGIVINLLQHLFPV